MSDYYDLIHDQEKEIQNGPYAWIQWKGTEVCADIHCECGHMGHVDADFCYAVECPACHRLYVMGQNVKLIPMPDGAKDEYEQTTKIANSGDTEAKR